MTLDALTKLEKASDHAVKWLALIVSVLTLITLWQSYKLHKIELSEKLEDGRT